MSIQSLLKPNGYNLFANSISAAGLVVSGNIIFDTLVQSNGNSFIDLSGNVLGNGNITSGGSLISDNAVFDKGDVTTLSGTTPYALTAGNLPSGIIVYNGDEGIPVTINLPDAEDIVTLFPDLTNDTVFTFTVIIGQLNNPGLVLNLAAGAGGSIGNGVYGISIVGPLALASGASGTWIGNENGAVSTTVLIDSPMINYSDGAAVMQRVCKLVLTDATPGSANYTVY